MKARKALSGLLFGAGCASAFMGLLGLIFPRIQNAQFQLVLASFETASRHWLVNLINALMRFVMQHGWAVLLAGITAALAGGLLLWFFLREPAREDSSYRRPASQAHPQSFIPQPPAAQHDVPDEAGTPLFAPKRQAEPAIEKIITAFASTPILELNRIEEASPPRDHSSPYARPAETPTAESVPLKQVVPDKPEPVLAPASLPKAPPPDKMIHTPAESSPLSPPAPMQSAEPLAAKPVSEEMPVPSRIRSTMGKHSQ